MTPIEIQNYEFATQVGGYNKKQVEDLLNKYTDEEKTLKTTRENFEKIFDMKEGEINIDSILAAWQTGTSTKVTRMAFSLWNACMYDSEQDIENEEKSNINHREL